MVSKLLPAVGAFIGDDYKNSKIPLRNSPRPTQPIVAQESLRILAMRDLITTRLAKLACRLTATRAMRRFARQQDGSTMVEFGLVAAPFLALVFAILETAIVFFSGQALEP